MYMNSKKQSSVDIARIAGVSQATVSRVLSGSPKVKKETRDMILQIMDEAGFRPNPFAQAMRTNQSRTVGVAVSRITNPIVPEILEELASHLAKKGRRTLVWNTDTEGEQGLIDAIMSRTIDGVIFTAASHQSGAIETALAEQLPVVSFNRYLEMGNCDQVVSTNQKGGAELAKYLVGCGRERIAFVNGPLDRTTLADRERGFRQDLKDAGRTLPDELYRRCDIRKNAFRQVALDLASGARRPDAIACGNDLIAIQVLNGLRAAHCRVPEDIWVTGFDGIEMSGWDIVNLTTMRQPLDLMAANAAEAIINRIDGKIEEPQTYEYQTELLVRESTENARPSGSSRSSSSEAR